MHETSKSAASRARLGHFERYLRGTGIDVGCGGDPLAVPEGTVRRWDKAEGDAQHLLGLEGNNFDFVYSSHCLEHLRDVGEALTNWLRVLRPGGFLYVVVPDYLLYEKLTFPSRYNDDHKHTFSLDPWLSRERVGRQNHWGPEDIEAALRSRGAELVEQGVQSDGFDFSRGIEDQTRGDALAQIFFVARKSTADV